MAQDFAAQVPLAGLPVGHEPVAGGQDRHSQATHVNISLRNADKVIKLSVTDNGAGFCAEKAWCKPKSFGLTGMRERAGLLGGKFEVRSAPGKGTKVMLELPLGAAPVIANGKNSRTVN